MKRRILTLTLAAVMAVSMVSGVVGTAFAKNGADDVIPQQEKVEGPHHK